MQLSSDQRCHTKRGFVRQDFGIAHNYFFEDQTDRKKKKENQEESARFGDEGKLPDRDPLVGGKN